MGNRDANITPTQHSMTPPAPHPKLPKLDPTHSRGACPPWDLLWAMIPYHWADGWIDAPSSPLLSYRYIQNVSSACCEPEAGWQRCTERSTTVPAVVGELLEVLW